MQSGHPYTTIYTYMHIMREKQRLRHCHAACHILGATIRWKSSVHSQRDIVDSQGSVHGYHESHMLWCEQSKQLQYVAHTHERMNTSTFARMLTSRIRAKIYANSLAVSHSIALAIAARIIYLAHLSKEWPSA